MHVPASRCRCFTPLRLALYYLGVYRHIRSVCILLWFVTVGDISCMTWRFCDSFVNNVTASVKNTLVPNLHGGDNEITCPNNGSHVTGENTTEQQQARADF